MTNDELTHWLHNDFEANYDTATNERRETDVFRVGLITVLTEIALRLPEPTEPEVRPLAVMTLNTVKP
jgi:hypothetical protein